MRSAGHLQSLQKGLYDSLLQNVFDKVMLILLNITPTSANLCPASLNFLPPLDGTREDLLCTDLESADACGAVHR